MAKIALITGITGQDGSYLAELLIGKGYTVHGLVRRSSSFNRQRIDELFSAQDSHKFLHYGDMTDFNSIMRILTISKPDEIYNLAAQSHVKISFEMPHYTAMADSIGVLNLLEAIRVMGITPRIYQASTSELFSGERGQAPQHEGTPFKPRSPYGVAKLYGFEISRTYRESYGMYVSNGILFNHESPRRGITFVTRKITKSVAEIIGGKRDVITLGHLDAHRDWGYAPEYVETMVKMLQLPKPDDFVVATGETHTVREFAERAFACVGMQLEWKGKGTGEEGIDRKSGKVLVRIDPDYFRPNEVEYLCGDARKAQKILGWKPKTTFTDLVDLMMEAELAGKTTP